MFNLTGILIGVVCVGGILLIFAAIGVFLIYSSYKGYQEAGDSQKWLSTAGQVIEARMTRKTDTDSDGDTKVSFAPYVRYSYRVGGKEYTSEKITFGFKQFHTQEEKASQELLRYPLGAQISVYYDPANPSEAVLDRSAGTSKTGLFIGVVFIVLSACLGVPIILGLLYNVLGAQ